MTLPHAVRGPVFVALVAIGTLLLVRSSAAADDGWQVVGLLAGGLGVASAALMLRDSVLKR